MRRFWQQHGRDTGRGTCALCALALVLLLFGDVIFLRASLAPIDYADVLATTTAPRTVSWLPERAGRTILHGQGDTGAAAYQLEPAARFMAFCIRHAQSPYWDPYTATGSLGPETLVDLKFSPLIIVTAIFGGSSKAFSFVLLVLYFWSAYCLLRALTAHLGFSMAAAFGASALFFLNGFALANLYTQIGQPYFLAPILLLALLMLTAKPGPGTFALAVGANVLFLATTFFPTLVLVAIIIYGFTFSLRTSETPARWRYFLVLHAALPVLALAVLSFLYIPIFAAYLTYLNTVSQYAARVTPGISLVNLLSLFTPKHFWESYRATRLPPPPPGDAYDPWVHYIGIVGPLIAIHAFSQLNRRSLWPIWYLGACWLTAFGQIFGIFPFTLLDYLPFFNFVRNEYWPAMLVMALVLLTAYGFDAIRAAKSFTLPCAALIGVIVCAYFAMGHHVSSLRVASPTPTALSGIGNSITLSIDAPSAQSGTVHHTVQFGGWALASDQQIIKVSIGVDGTDYGDAAYGVRRDDVCRSYPGRPGCPHVGWNFWLDTTQFSNGPHTLTVTAYTPTGRLTQTRRFVISNPWAPSYLAVFWIVLISSSLLFAAARTPRLALYAKLALLGLLVVEGIFYMNNLRPYRSDRDEHLSPVLAWLNTRVHDEPGSRILNIGRSGVFPNWGSALQIPQLGDLNSGELPWYRDFFDSYIGLGLFLSLGNQNSTFLFTDDSLSLTGVHYVVVDRRIDAAVNRLSAIGYKVVRQDSIRVVFENPHPMPRAFVVHDWNDSGSLTVHASSEPVEVVSYLNTRVCLRCNLRRPGELVLMDSWHPDWTAEVGGKEVQVRKVYGAFRGIELQAGENEVVFYYKSSDLVVGETVSVVMCASLITALLIWRRRKLADRK